MPASEIFPNLTAAEAARYLDLQAARSRPLRLHGYRSIALGHRRRVLEVGCGSGAVLRELQDRVPFAAGVDPDFRPGLSRIAAAVGEHLPFRGGPFDALFLHYVLLWVPDLAAFLAEARRVLAPGAPLVLLAEPLIGEVRGADGPWFRRLHEEGGIHAFTLGTLEKVLRDQGFAPALARAKEDASPEAEWDALNAKLLGRRAELVLPLAYGTASP
jgi:SAM-dependent methyltransferase